MSPETSWISLFLTACSVGLVTGHGEDPYHPRGRVRRDSPAVRAKGRRDFQIPYADWDQVARDELQIALNKKQNTNVAKNVILVIGDGMGPSTVTATRMYKAQEQDVLPHQSKLSWELFDHTGVSKTYNSDVQNPDSAATATAFSCGEKARQGTIGVNDNVVKYNCDQYDGNTVKSILKHAMDEGKWAGVVTDTRLTHATPSSTYASTPAREWEAQVPDHCAHVKDIAQQMIYGEHSKDFRVLLGGGRSYFLPNTTSDVEYPEVKGRRTDGLDLIEEWKRLKQESQLQESQYQYVYRQSQFDAVNPATTDYLLGMFEPDHMQYEDERADDTFGEPELAEMVEKAVKILQRSEKGYFMLIEGGRIDHAHHDNWAKRAMLQTLALDRAVQRLTELTSADDTLIVVTADHSHVFNIGADSDVRNDVFGLVVDPLGATLLAEDGKPQFLFYYANGPGYKYHRSLTDDYGNETARRDITEDIKNNLTASPGYALDGPIPKNSESHGGEDVVIYARGPLSHLFSGTHEQNFIAHASMYAACVGPNMDHCKDTSYAEPSCWASVSTLVFGLTLVICTNLRL